MNKAVTVERRRPDRSEAPVSMQPAGVGLDVVTGSTASLYGNCLA